MKINNKHLIKAAIEQLEEAQKNLLKIIEIEDSEIGSDVDLYDKVNDVLLSLEDLGR